jgi:hypothetical protein
MWLCGQARRQVSGIMEIISLFRSRGAGRKDILKEQDLNSLWRRLLEGWNCHRISYLR